MYTLQIGCCISSHGFGHAARVLAIMEELAGMVDFELSIATLVPEWFLRSCFSGTFSLYPIQTDVGLVQKTPLEEDYSATLTSLGDYYPVREKTLQKLASAFTNSSLVVCDISPAGILAAQKAGVPSVLIENFTWDWIYEGYSQAFPEFNQYIDYLREINMKADYRIQTMPVCDQTESDLVVSPVARAFCESREAVRNRLQVAKDIRMVLVSMGGIGINQLPLDKLKNIPDTVFVVSGYKGENLRSPNVKLLPPDMDFIHSDLVKASDVVIGKVGYSTLAEVYHADVPFGYVCRPEFRESVPLVSFIREEMCGLEIELQDFLHGHWVDQLPKLLQLRKKGLSRQNGAIQCAKFLMSLCGKSDS